MEMLYALLAFCLFGSALAQVPGLGSCPEVKVQKHLDLSKYMGPWYEQRRYLTMFEFGTKCNIVDYSPGENGTIKVIDYYVTTYNGKPGAIVEHIHLPNMETPTRMRASPPLLPNGTVGDYLILGTDYETYSVVFGCVDYKYMHLRYSWILTRDRFVDKSVLGKAYKVLRQNNLNTRIFYKVEQDTCEEHEEHSSE